MASIDFINECKNYAYENRYGKLILGEPTTAETGSSVSITDARASRLLETKMSKLSTQETTTGKNLLSFQNENVVSNQVTTTNKNSEFTITGTLNGTWFNITNTSHKITIPAGTYTFSSKYALTHRVVLRGSTKTVVIGNGVQSITFTLDETDTIFLFADQLTTGTQFNETLYLMLESGSPATSWEQYSGNQPSPSPTYPQEIKTIKTNVDITITNGVDTNTETIPLGDNEICGIGNYKDELIVDKNGHCWLNKKIGKVVLNGEENWGLSGNSANNQYYLVYDDFPIGFDLTNKILSNYFTCVNQRNSYSDNTIIGIGGWYEGSQIRISMDTSIVNRNLTAFENWLSTHNTTVYYQIATPQLIDLNYDVDLTLFEGTNNISNSEDMDMEIIYKASVELNQSNKIQEFTIDSGCYDNGNIVGSVYVTKLNAQLIDALDNTLENVDCDASVGVKYDNDTTEYVNLGSYVIEKPKDEQTTNFSSFVAYDRLMNYLEEKYSTSLDYDNETITLADVYEELCTGLGLTPVTTTFTNSTLVVGGNPFTNGETNRIVLNAIAKVACAFIDIDDETNEIDLKWLSDSLDYTFQKSDYSTVEGGKTVYGPVNSLIIKSSAIDDENVSYSDETSILKNGEHQLVINEDYFLYNQEKREEALMPIWNKVNGLTYTECTLNTLTGKPFLKKGAKIRIYLDEENYIDSYVLQNEFKYNGVFANTIKCPVLTEQQVQTKQNATLNEKLKQTEIIVNKQDNTITEIVGQINETNEVLNGVIVTTTESERKIEIISTNIDENGEVTSVRTTDGFTFNNEGMNITKSGEAYNTQHTYRGSYFKDGNTIVGQVDVNGGKFKDVDLYGIYRYGKNSIDDEPMFIAQLYTDSNNEECFGHFWNGG